jgi:hypothetical protein
MRTPGNIDDRKPLQIQRFIKNCRELRTIETLTLKPKIESTGQTKMVAAKPAGGYGRLVRLVFSGQCEFYFCLDLFDYFLGSCQKVMPARRGQIKNN